MICFWNADDADEFAYVAGEDTKATAIRHALLYHLFVDIYTAIIEMDRNVVYTWCP
jgi:hypothetical protein